jgi:hypothetical protein
MLGGQRQRGLQCLGVCDQWDGIMVCPSNSWPRAGSLLWLAGREEQWPWGAMVVTKEPMDGLAGRHGGGTLRCQVEELHHSNSYVVFLSFCHFFVVCE